MAHTRINEFLESGQFESVYYELVDELTLEPSLGDMSDTLKWLERVLYHNVPDGKKFRGLLVPLSYQALVPNGSKQEIKLASVLGWCLEMLHAARQMGEDFVYERDVRRGRACWYRLDNLGTAASNDAFLIEHAVYRILSKYFKSRSIYGDIVGLFLRTTYNSILGHSLDARARKENKLEEYTMERYKSVVKYTTSYYTYYLPLALAMAIAGLTDVRLRNKVADIALEIGHLSQVRKDFLNCFGEGEDGRERGGQVGTDIRHGKITWLFVTARQGCPAAQLTSLFENYGRDNETAVAIVKGLYTELKLPRKYKIYEAEMASRIEELISGMEGELPESIFRNLVEIFYTKAT